MQHEIVSRPKRGRALELTPKQAEVLREMSDKGRKPEELAVGFGLSFNTVRNYLSDESEAPGSDTPGGA